MKSGITESCKGLNLRLVPKFMAGMIPISVEDASNYDLVYMDDYKYLRYGVNKKRKREINYLLRLS